LVFIGVSDPEAIGLSPIVAEEMAVLTGTTYGGEAEKGALI
jgi:hypothetical protein